MIPMLYCDAITDAMTKGLGQQKACVRYNILTSSLDVLFLFFLLPKYGMKGYLLSFFVTHLLNFLLSLGRLLKITQKRIPLRIPIFAICATVFSVIFASMANNMLVKSVGFVVILGCLLFLFRVLRKEDIAWMKGIVVCR